MDGDGGWLVYDTPGHRGTVETQFLVLELHGPTTPCVNDD